MTKVSPFSGISRVRRPVHGALAVLFLVGAGCSFYEPSQPEAVVTLPAAFSETGKAVLPEKWWTAWKDPQLDALIEQALSRNLSLRVTWDRLAQARALARREGASAWPSLEASAGGTGSVSGVDGSSGPGPSASTSQSMTFSAGLAASYEVDLWGRVRSSRKAAELDVLASDRDLHAAAMTLSAEVANAWFRLKTLRGQLLLLDAQRDTNRDYLEIVKTRFRRGQVSAADVIQQEQALEAVRGDRLQVMASLRVEENRLAGLLGKPAGAYKAPGGDVLPRLPPLPAMGTPAAWVQRRPDLQAALLRVQAADRRVAAAIAERFPRLSLSARASVSHDVCDVFTSWLSNLAANLMMPLIDGGRRKAEVERSRAVVSERLHQYGQVLLRSLEEVENALVQEARQEDVLGSLEKQRELSGAAVERASSGYKKGTVDFTRFLSTVLGHQRLERSHLQARRDLILYRIRLYRSLGGSWDLAQPANIPSRSGKE
ncbi:MAG: efflux transporter outer membrane subunit [Planctomycetota bacterium]|jgi:NodT family efflux transporter outer membrane factor (OMF) lipoprotein